MAAPTSSTAKQVYQFKNFVLDLEAGVLLRAGVDLPIRAKTYDLLCFLAANAGRVVSKEELQDAIWGRVHVTEDSLVQCIRDLRRVLGDSEQTIVKTVQRRGYRFVDEAARSVAVSEPVMSDETPHRADGPSIAVLPFANLVAKKGGDYFADGMVEEITTALSCVRWLRVISSGSTLTYRKDEFDPAHVGRELGVRYVVTGSVRRSSGSVRMTGHLTDTATGNQLWADRFEGPSTDLFRIQDLFTERIVGALQPKILAAETERSRRKRPGNLVAYDYILRAFPLVWRLERHQNDEARSLLEAALAHDADYPLALSLLAWCHAQRATYNWSDDVTADRELSVDLAEKAVVLSADDGLVLTVLGAVHTFGRNFSRADAVLTRARKLDPNSAWTWLRSAWLDVFQGNPDTGIAMFQRFQSLSPRDPMGHMALIGIGSAMFVAGKYEDSIEWTRRGLAQAPGAMWAVRHLAAALALAGRLDEARSECRRLMDAYSGLDLADVRKALPFGADAVERIVDGLRQAGYPDASNVSE